MAASGLLGPATRFAGLPSWVRFAVLGLFAAAIAALCAVALAQPAPAPPTGRSDLAMYGRVVEALRQGSDYYVALADQLRVGGYGMQSVFNWRTPLLMSLAAWLPSVEAAQVLMGGVAVAGLVLATMLAFRELRWWGAIVVAATGVLSLVMVVIDRTVLMAEIPAGILILLSASAYGLGERRLGFGAAVLALFLRELTAPYVLVCAYLAWREGRRRELALWLVAVMAYGAYYLWHAHMVELVLLPADRTAPGWLQFGGATFLLRTAQFDGYFTTAPLWLIALMLPAAWLGLLAWPGPAGERVALTVTLYLVLFAVGGRSVNSYWGPIYTPLLIFGFAWLPPALRDLVRGLPRKLEQPRRPDAVTEPTALVQ